MPKTLNIALLQMDPCASEAAAITKAEAFCRIAKKKNAEIALFPEMWNNGYSFPNSEGEVELWKSGAVSSDSVYVKHFKNLAQDLQIFIGITFLEKHSPLPRNTFLLLDKSGSEVLKYSKVHTCDFGSERFCSPGNDFPVARIETSIGQVSVGAMICFDREFPESSRILMLNGAEVVLIPNACDIEENRRNQLLTRSFENMFAVAMANYSSIVGNGNSVAFDGMAFEYDSVKNKSVTRNQVAIEADGREGVFIACLNILALREYRSEEVWGNSYRKVAAYAKLLDREVDNPFRRNDSRTGS